MENKVYLEACSSYNEKEVAISIRKLLIDNDLLDFVKPGMRIGIKANLVTHLNPDKAATTHPVVIKELVNLLLERKASVVIGDSPGGVFNASYLKSIYNATKMTDLVEENVELNQNFNQETRKINGTIVKELDCTSWLFSCDAIINFSKLKTHAMMGLSAATKNLFGTVPGILKPEYHYRYPKHEDFAAMLVDINEFYHCDLNIVDGIIGMEGNGPTMGTPRFIGCLLASRSPYAIDSICAKIINIDPLTIPTISNAFKRGLVANAEDIETNIDFNKFFINDYKTIKTLNGIGFDNQFKGPFKNLTLKIVRGVLQVKPKVNKKECIGCMKCYNICPAKAITMKNNYPEINRNKCIRCFCCQEFCPKGAMKAKRNFLMNKIKNV